MIFFIGIVIFVIFIIVKLRNVSVNWKSLRFKKLKYLDDRFGVYLITGKQGTNKTYYSIQLCLNQDLSKVNYIKTNIKSLKIPNVNIVYFEKISDVYFDTDENVIYIIDELSRKYKKNSLCDTDFYAWLNQCRKRKRIFIGITQEYKELPLWLRRPCRYMLNSYELPILTKLFNIFACNIGDGYNLTFNKDEGEYECPTLKTIVYKRNVKVGSMYDTFEPINEL